jgi:SAM-dependent methyltransferase
MTMSESNQTQIDLWDGRVGAKWAAMQSSLDAMMAPATVELTARAGAVAGQRVLDIGCGNGVTCLAWLDAGALVTGVDVSAAMLAVAAQRTGGKATLIQADASVWKGAAPFDLAVSQFGVMFFADPDQAFSAIADNLRPGGRLLFTCWRAIAHNPWASLPLGAVQDLVPDTTPATPDAPGPFALADEKRLAGILQRSGYTGISITPLDIPVCIAVTGGTGAAVQFVMQIGPASMALAQADPAAKAVAKDRLHRVLAPHERQGRVTLAGAIWVVEAFRPENP